jgi:uncharacterized protein
MTITLTLLLGLLAAGAVAGFIDAIAGGGGLITVPVLLLTGLPPHLVLGTNKGQSVFGSGMALKRFSRSTLLDRPRALVSVLPSLAGAAAGACLVSFLNPRILTPLIVVLLMAIAVFTLVQRPPHTFRPPKTRSPALAALVAGSIAAYDGFFGPGTGTILIMAYVWLWHDSLDSASANAKVVNFLSNLASLAAFTWLGLVDLRLALPMGLGQLLGGYCGARLTIHAGPLLVRSLVTLVSLTLVARIVWDFYK